MHNNKDTIAAIATPPGESGIGIVRISGRGALKIIGKVFKPKDSRKVSNFKTHTLHYGWIVVPPHSSPSPLWGEGRGEGENEIIDEVLLTVMRAPKSYTREDMVEINCHGGIVAMRKALKMVLENGCRLAEPGEFTKRAFLNGRLYLAQAEAVLDVIRAKTDSALKLGTEQLKGILSSQINNLRDGLLKALAALEADIDFPEEQTAGVNLKQVKVYINRVNSALKNILDYSSRGRILREGIHVVICGKPNVGKSSLLNALLKCERSIVTPVAGTTRDTIEEAIDIKGIPVRIVDTAGIIEPRDLVEKKAVQRSRRFIDSADLAILLFDNSKILDGQDKALIERLKKKPAIAVINKIDLRQRIEKNKLKGKFKRIIQISAKRIKNIDLLEDAIRDFVYGGEVSIPEYAVVSNIRHIEALRHAQKFTEAAKRAIEDGLDTELVSQDIKDAMGFLDDISGRRFSEKLLDKIFSEFCIGK